MSAASSSTAGPMGANASQDVAKRARLTALAAKKAEFAARLARAKSVRRSRNAPPSEDDDEDEDEDEEEHEEEELSSGGMRVNQRHNVSKSAARSRGPVSRRKVADSSADEADEFEDESEEAPHQSVKQHKKSPTTHGSNKSSTQQRGSKLQKRTGDQDTSTGAEVGMSDESPIDPSSKVIKTKLEMRHYFLPTESASWQLSPIEFERFGLKPMTQSNEAIMFPSLPPVWKRDNIYVPESFKNEQSQISLEERTSDIMYDVDHPSRPHRRMVLPQIYPNAVQTEQLNLLLNQDAILDELKKTAPLITGRDDPSIRSLFGHSTISNDLTYATRTSATENDTEMKAASSPSSLTTSTGVQAEIDAAATKCYALDYSLATSRKEITPWMFHFHARPDACVRERMKSDELFFDDLLLAKQVQEKVNLLMNAIKDHESKMSDDESKTTPSPIRLLHYSKIYRDLQASRDPAWASIAATPTGDLALFLSWFISDSTHELKSRQFACEFLLRLLLSPLSEQELDEEDEDKDVDEQEEEEKEEEKNANADDASGENDKSESVICASTSSSAEASISKKNSLKKVSPNASSPSANLRLDSSDICGKRLESFRSFSQLSRLGGAERLGKRKERLTTDSRVSEILAHELAAMKGLLFQFALKKTDETLLASIIKVLGLISAVEDFSGSWLTYIQALAYSAGTYDLPIRTGVSRPDESDKTAFSCLGQTALIYSETYPLPQAYNCFTILFDLCTHHYMLGRTHFAMSNGVFDLIQSIVGTTLVQRLWQPNEEPQILNAILECTRNSGQAPAINLAGYINYALMDLIHRAYLSGDYSLITSGTLPLSMILRLNSWNATVVHGTDDLVLDDSTNPNVFTEESSHWIVPFIRLIFQQSGTAEWTERMKQWERSLWRNLPYFTTGEGNDPWNAAPVVVSSTYQVEAWRIWRQILPAWYIYNPIKIHTFDVEAHLLDLMSLLLPRMQSTVDAQWYAWHGGNQMKWKDYDLKLLTQAGSTVRDESTVAGQFLTKWWKMNCVNANMAFGEAGSARQRLMPVLTGIIGAFHVYDTRLKLEAKGEMIWSVATPDGSMPACLQKALNERENRPDPAPIPESERYQHLQPLTLFERGNWIYLAKSAISIGLIQVDSTHPLGYSYVNPDLEYDPQQHRDLSPEINLLLEALASFECSHSAPLKPHLNFLRPVVLKYMSESIHLSMRLQALCDLKVNWKDVCPLVGQDLDYTARVELVKSFGVNELNIPNVLMDIIADYAVPRRAIHHSYMNLLREGVQSAFPLVRLYSRVVLESMYESSETIPISFAEYYFSIIFEGLVLELQSLIASKGAEAAAIASPTTSITPQPNSFTKEAAPSNEVDPNLTLVVDGVVTATYVDEAASKKTDPNLGFKQLAGDLIALLKSIIPSNGAKPRATLTPTFLEPYYQRFKQLIGKNDNLKSIKHLIKLRVVMRKIVKPKEKDSDPPVTASQVNVSDPTKPFVFSFGSTTTAGTNSSLSSTTTDPYVINPPLPTGGAGVTTAFQGFDFPFAMNLAPTPLPDPTQAIQISNSVLEYLSAHPSDYAVVHQYHLNSTNFHQNQTTYDPQIWFRTLQPLLELVNNTKDDINQLITILTQLLERPNLAPVDVLTILYALSPFIALVTKRISIKSTASATPFMFNFTLPPPTPTTATATAATNSTATPTPFVFDLGTSQSSTTAPPTNQSPSAIIAPGEQSSVLIFIDPNPPEYQLPALIHSLVDSLFRVLRSTEQSVDVVIGNLVSTHITQLIQAPSLTRPNIEKWVRGWISSCPPHSFQIEEDDYLRSPPCRYPFHPVNDSNPIHSLGIWSLPADKTRFRFLLHVHLTSLDSSKSHIVEWSKSVRPLFCDYFIQYLVTTSTPPLSRQACLFLLSFLRYSETKGTPDVFARWEPITLLNKITHLVESLTLIPSVEWTNTDDLFSDELIQFMDRSTMQNEEVFPYKPHQRSQKMIMGRFIFLFLERLGQRSRAYLEGRASEVEKRYQSEKSVKTPLNQSTSSTGARPSAAAGEAFNPFQVGVSTSPTDRSGQDPSFHTTLTPLQLFEVGFRLFWMVCSTHVRLFVGIFSIIQPFCQLDPDNDAVKGVVCLLKEVVPSLNTAVRGLKSHPDRTLFYHAPRKGSRYTCLTCTKSYAGTSSYYDPIDDSHWCFNCLEWTNDLTTSFRTRSEFDRIYQLQVKEFHDQQLLTGRPSASKVATLPSTAQFERIVTIDTQPNQVRAQAITNIIITLNRLLFVIRPDTHMYNCLLTDLSLTPSGWNELKEAHLNDLKRCLERDLSEIPSTDLPKLPSLWQQTFRSVTFAAFFTCKWYEYPQLLPLVTQVLTRGLESEVFLNRIYVCGYLYRERNHSPPRQILRHYYVTCQQPSQPPNQVTNSFFGRDQSDKFMTVGERFEYSLLQTIGCSDPVLRSFARTRYVARGKTVATLLLMDYINKKPEIFDSEVLQPSLLPPLTYSLQTIPFIYAFIREHFNSEAPKNILATIKKIIQALNFPVRDPQLREARGSLGRFVQEKWLGALTLVEKVNSHKATCAYAKLVQEGINSSSPRTPRMPKTVVQFLAKLASNILEDEMVALYQWLLFATEHSTAETVLLSQFDSDDVNTAIHDTPQLRSTLDAMITLQTLLPFLPSHLPAIKSHLPLMFGRKSPLFASLLRLSSCFELMTTRCLKSPILRRLVIHPYYNLWITCSMLRAYYTIPLLGPEGESESPFMRLFLERLKYSDEEEMDLEDIENPTSTGSIVLLTELLMYPSIIHGDVEARTNGTIATVLSIVLPSLFDDTYKFSLQKTQVDLPEDGWLNLPSLSGLFIRIRGWMFERLPKMKRIGFFSPKPADVGNTSISCVFIDTFALMIQTAIQLPQLTPNQSSTLAQIQRSELLCDRLVELLPIVLATFHLCATSSLANLNGESQPLLVSMRQYIRVLHRHFKLSSTRTSSITTTADSHDPSVNRLTLIIQLYLPILLQFYRVDYMNLINQIEWSVPVDGLNFTRTRKWSWIDVPESALLNELEVAYTSPSQSPMTPQAQP